MTKRRTNSSYNGSYIGSVLGMAPGWVAMVATLATLAGFYYNTTYSITELKTKSETDTKARESLREALTLNSDKTATAIAELAKHSAVQDERTANITTTLQTIQGQLSNISTAVGPSSSRHGKP